MRPIHPGPARLCRPGDIDTGGYNIEGTRGGGRPKGAQIVDGPVEARRANRDSSNAAPTGSVYMTHRSWIDKKEPFLAAQLTLEEIRALVDDEARLGKKVAVKRTTASA